MKRKNHKSTQKITTQSSYLDRGCIERVPGRQNPQEVMRAPVCATRRALLALSARSVAHRTRHAEAGSAGHQSAFVEKRNKRCILFVMVQKIKYMTHQL